MIAKPYTSYNAPNLGVYLENRLSHKGNEYSDTQKARTVLIELTMSHWLQGAGPSSSKIQPVAEADKVKQFLEFMFEHSERLFKDLIKDDYVEAVL